jgi:hypothetical protein
MDGEKTIGSVAQSRHHENAQRAIVIGVSESLRR